MSSFTCATCHWRAVKLTECVQKYKYCCLHPYISHLWIRLFFISTLHQNIFLFTFCVQLIKAHLGDQALLLRIRGCGTVCCHQFELHYDSPPSTRTEDIRAPFKHCLPTQLIVLSPAIPLKLCNMLLHCIIAFCFRHSQAKCIVATAICVPACLYVPYHSPTLLHRPRCNFGEW